MLLSERRRRQGRRALLYHTFATEAAAGAVAGPATGRGAVGTLTVVDTEGKITEFGGALVFAGGKAAPATGDPGGWLEPAVARTPGQAFLGRVTPTAANTILYWGLDTGKTGIISDGLKFHSDGLIYAVLAGVDGPAVGAYSAGVAYDPAIVLRAAGFDVSIKGGAYTTRKLLLANRTGTSGPYYLAVSNNNAALSVQFALACPRRLPQPYALYDAFASKANGALHGSLTLGDAETGTGFGITHRAPGGWNVNSGVLRNSIAAEDYGPELLTNGNMEDGNPPAGWSSAGMSGTVSGSADERTGGTGAQSLDIARNGAAYVAAKSNFTAAVGSWYALRVWIRNVDATSVLAFVATQAGPTVPLSPLLTITSTSWTQITQTNLATATTLCVTIFGNTAAGVVSVRADDASAKVIRASALFASDWYSTPNVVLHTTIAALTSGTRAGLHCCRDTDGIGYVNNGAGYGIGDTSIAIDGLCKAIASGDSVKIGTVWYALDSVGAYSGGVQTVVLSGAGLTATCADNARVDIDDVAANHMTALLDGGNLVVGSRVAGTYATVSTTARAWAANDEMQVIKDGAVLAVYYKVASTGVWTKIGADNAIPAGLQNFTYAGAFSTDEVNTISVCGALARGAEGQYDNAFNAAIREAGETP